VIKRPGCGTNVEVSSGGAITVLPPILVVPWCGASFIKERTALPCVFAFHSVFTSPYRTHMLLHTDCKECLCLDFGNLTKKNEAFRSKRLLRFVPMLFSSPV
jgi:hypothetical protein